MVYRFDEFEVDDREFRLSEGGTPLQVEPKVLRLLLYLIQNRNRLTRKQELLDNVWHDAMVTENALTRVIGLLRKALNDDSHVPRFIETVPTAGYRFIAPVIEVKGTEGGSAAEDTNLATPARPDEVQANSNIKTRVSLRKLAITSGLVVALMAASVWAWERWRARTPQLQSLPHITSLAVLPLANLSGDPSQDYLADGMTDEITTDLARIRSLRVISETSAMRYRGTHQSLRQIAQELDVDAVVEGSVARSGDRVRITAQLVDAKKDRHLWAQSYERQAGDILGLQRDLSKAIASQVHISLTPAEQRRLEVLPTHDPNAYDAYLRAKYHVNTAMLQLEADADATIAEAEQAVTLDPDFAEAYVVLAQGCFPKIFDWAGGKEYDEKGSVALSKALALDPALAEAYAVRGMLYYTRFHSFDIAAAVADNRRAIFLNPNLALAHHDLAAWLTHAGLHEKAIEESRAALRLDPQNAGTRYQLSRALWQSQRFAEALQSYDRYNIENFEKALTLAYLGRRAQAWETIERVAQQLGGGFIGGGNRKEDVAAVRAFLYATEGQPQKAEQQIQVAAHLGKNNDHFHHAAFIMAAAYAEMGKPHEAVVWLRRVAEGGMPNYPLFHDNPSMIKLHDNPEYDQFMAEFKPHWDQLANVIDLPA